MSDRHATVTYGQLQICVQFGEEDGDVLAQTVNEFLRLNMGLNAQEEELHERIDAHTEDVHGGEDG